MPRRYRWPTISTTTRTIPRPVSGLRTSRASPTAACSSTGSGRSRSASRSSCSKAARPQAVRAPRDTIPEVLALVAEHPAVDAIIYLGLGIQSNQARMLREGGFFPDYGLDRIVAYHERQDMRFANAAADISLATGKPILTATEL